MSRSRVFPNPLSNISLMATVADFDDIWDDLNEIHEYHLLGMEDLDSDSDSSSNSDIPTAYVEVEEEEEEDDDSQVPPLEDQHHQPGSSRSTANDHLDNNTEEEEEEEQEHAEPKRAKYTNATHSEDTDDDGTICPICLDKWTSCGEHRLASLKCGHLFGHKCILHWIKSCTGAQKRCPQCNIKATIKDVRLLYAKKLTAIDTSEIKNFKKILKTTNLEKQKLETKLKISVKKKNKYRDQVKILKREVDMLRSAVNSLPEQLKSKLKEKEELLTKATLWIPGQHRELSTITRWLAAQNNHLDVDKWCTFHYLKKENPMGQIIVFGIPERDRKWLKDREANCSTYLEPLLSK